MFRFPLLCVLFSAFVVETSLAQTDPACIQALRTARATYEQGRLHELPTLLDGCLTKFSQTEKVEAYKLLVLTYIYLEEPQKADEAMLNLLRTDHFFEINEGTDPAEFRNLYSKFRTEPIFSIGARASFLNTLVNVQKHHYIFGNGLGSGTYTSKLRVAGGVTFEKEIIKKKLIIAPELFFTGRSFIYSNSNIFQSDTDPSTVSETGLEATIVQNLFQLNLLAHYQFDKQFFRGKFQPYAGAGLATSYLTSGGSSFLGELTIESGGDDVSGATLDNTNNYKQLNFSAVLLLGGKIKVSSLYFTADIRYFHGLNNVVNKENRNSMVGDNVEILTRYGYVNNDFSINQGAISIGLIYPYFKPKKLIK